MVKKKTEASFLVISLNKSTHSAWTPKQERKALERLGAHFIKWCKCGRPIMEWPSFDPRFNQKPKKCSGCELEDLKCGIERNNKIAASARPSKDVFYSANVA